MSGCFAPLSWSLDIDLLTSVLAALILFAAYFIRGISGFGSGLVAIPLLAHLLPLQFVVPWVLVLDFTASVTLGAHRQDRRSIGWREIGWLLPTTAGGMLLGVLLLVRLPQAPLLGALGLFVLAFGLRSLLSVQGRDPLSRWWALPAGLVGGTVGSLFGTGGPPYVIYLTRRIRQPRELRATFSGLFMLDGGMRLLVFTLSGLLTQDDMPLACAAGLPVMALGLYAGHRVHLGLKPEQMSRIIGALLVVSGISLLLRALE